MANRSTRLQSNVCIFAALIGLIWPWPWGRTASIQQKGTRWYCQVVYCGKRRTFSVGRVSMAEAETKAAQVEYLLMRLGKG